jgi:hypothetical protein
MKQIYRIFLIVILFVGVNSCELPDNIDPKSPAEVTPESLFLNAQINLVDYVSSINQNLNNSRLLAQYAAQTTYIDESRYNFYDRQFNDALWDVLYHNVLLDLLEAKTLIEADPSIFTTERYNNMLAAIDVLAVYAYHVLVDQFGNVPYTEALGGVENPTPAYDDAQTIYEDLISRLETAANNFDNTDDIFGAYDWFYSSDVDSWILFTNSLRLRLAMRLADVDPALAQAQVEDAVADGVFTSQSESVKFSYPGIDPNIYTIYEEMIQGGRKDFVPANTIVDTMNYYNDPRLDLYFDLAPGQSAFIGGTYGASNVYGGTASYFDNELNQPDFTFTLIDFVEVSFFLAEAAERTWAVGGTAAGHYNNAITASIIDWGGDAADATTYLAQATVDYATLIGGGATWREVIGLQKWIAHFERGVEAWAEWRRLDEPMFFAPPDMTYADIPVRQPYPFNEDNLNLENYNAASTAIGGDEVSTRLFWDTNASPYIVP